MATATPTSTPTTQCTGCGAKIPTTVSICPYCVTPQPSAAAKAQASSPTLDRLRKLKEKPEFQAGLAWRPMEGLAFRRAARRARRGVALAALGVVVLGTALSAGGDLARASSVIRLAAGGALALVGLAQLVRGLQVKRQTLARPLLVRAARVAERRSETEIRGARGITTYYFQLEFDDGSEGEFFFVGRGASDEPLTNGVTGVAYTRGPELLAFKRVRV